MSQQNQSNTEKKDSVFDNDKDTPVVAAARRTGQGNNDSDTRDGAEPEAPGNRDTDVPGNPNQGTEAR